MSKRGNCYVTCEALYHLLGGKKAGYTPMVMKHEGDTHWFIKYRATLEYPDYRSEDYIIDPTAKQFKTPPDYTTARGCGFLTKRPSKRARTLMKKMLWQ